MSNGRLTIELDTKIDDYGQAEAKAQRTQARTVIEREALNGEARRAREALEQAIAEAIERGKPEPEPDGRARELIDELLAANKTYPPETWTPASAQRFTDARTRMISYIETREQALAQSRALCKALQRERDNLLEQIENAQDNAERKYEAEIADLHAALDMAHTEHAQAARDRDEIGRMCAAACEAGAKQLRELGEARAEISQLEEALRATDSTSESTPASDAELETLRAERAELQASLGIARGERDARSAAIKEIGSRILAHAERLSTVRAWLDVLAEGYLTPEGVTVGARKARNTLTEIIRETTGK